MLRLRGYKIRWDYEDVHAMSKILGGEFADRRQAPCLDSILKLAKRRHVKLDRRAERQLAYALKERAGYDLIRNASDARSGCFIERKAFAHQRADLAYIRYAGLPAYLIAHQPGVGKTLVALIASSDIWKAKRVLVICPNKAKRQWRREILRWLGHQRITIIEGTIDEQNAQAQSNGWVIGHWESLVHAADGYLDAPWDLVILDEAHYIANRHTQRADTAHALEATHRLALTGHPFTNETNELFSILKFLYPKQYTSYWRFLHMHVKISPKPFGGFDVLGARRPKLLQWEIAPFTLRRTKADVFTSLPSITRQRVDVELTKRGRAEYEKLKKQLFVELDALGGDTKTIPILNDLARLTRLRQYLVDPGLIGARESSVKYAAVLEWLDDLDGPPVLFTSFRQAGERIIAYLKKKRKTLRIGFVHGKQKASVSDEIQTKFLKGKFDLVVMVTAAAKESLNFGKYGYVGHLDLPWNPRDLEQTEGRVDRPEEGTGKLVPTTAWRFIVADSYEERLEEKLEKKHGMFGEVFTVGELKSLFR